jgi:hypothetical protein
VSFFFDGAPTLPGAPVGSGASPSYVTEFLATSGGLALGKAFMRIKDFAVRRSIVRLVQQLATNELTLLDAVSFHVMFGQE